MGRTSFGAAGRNLRAHWVVLPSSRVLLHASQLPCAGGTPASRHYPSPDAMGHGRSGVIPRRCISLLAFCVQQCSLGAAALPGISDSCLQLQLFPDKRLAPPRLGLGLFGECCRGGLSCSLLQECWPDGQILLPSCKMSDVGRLWESSLPVPPPLDKPAWPAPPCHGNGPFQPQPQ